MRAPARLNWPAPRETSQAIDDAEFDLVVLAAALKKQAGARYLVEANPHLARSLRARWSRWRPGWKEADGLITRDAAALAALGEHRFSARAWSPSSLEQFAVCPYKFALHGIHRLRPREEAAPLQYMDPLTRGALFHEVQFALLGELRGGGAVARHSAALGSRRWQRPIAPWSASRGNMRRTLRRPSRAFGKPKSRTCARI